MLMAVEMKRTLLLLALTGTALGGCNMAPAYHPAQVPVPEHFAETPGWQQAVPMDGEARGNWWEAFNDPSSTLWNAGGEGQPDAGGCSGAL
jgi:multidrug efflux system outer membrane protein